MIDCYGRQSNFVGRIWLITAIPTTYISQKARPGTVCTKKLIINSSKIFSKNNSN